MVSTAISGTEMLSAGSAISGRATMESNMRKNFFKTIFVFEDEENTSGSLRGWATLEFVEDAVHDPVGRSCRDACAVASVLLEECVYNFRDER